MKQRFWKFMALLLVTALLAGCGAAPEGPGTKAPESTGSAAETSQAEGTDSGSSEGTADTAEPSAAPEDESGPVKPADFGEENGLWTFSEGGVTVLLDPDTGFVTGLRSAEDEIRFGRLLIDAGVQEESLFFQLGYKDMSPLATYELPLFYPRMRDLPDYRFEALTRTADGFDVVLRQGEVRLCYHYSLLPDALALTAELMTDSAEPLYVNGVGFVLQGLEDFDLSESTYEFPGCTPAGRRSYASSMRYRATSADYSAPVIQIRSSEDCVNLLFVDEVEKWTTGAYFDEKDRPCGGFMAAAEGTIDAAHSMTVGTLYLPLHKPEADPYDEVAAFWTLLGYHTPSVTSEMAQPYAVYSAHPYGTMDTGYFNRLTLDEYAEQMDAVAAMGFDAVWLLPVFKHTGDNVYEPIDQAVIDKRYGGEEAAKVFIDRAHELGLSVLFDFVPHGPRPHYAFAKEHDEWIAKDRDGNNRIEWGCVSFDYNHPDYYDYNRDLAAMYARDFGLDGGRIDCSMGGLPDWQSSEGLRASAAGLMAGKNVVKALREGFLEASGRALLLPENFHPSPAYAEVTDVFYDMPLYRCLFDLNHSGCSEAEFTAELTQFLEAEHRTSVPGQLKLRFLGNHDTVSWTFDAARAQKVYGTEKAKALWMLMAFIDGTAFIYQGDEDPAAYHLKGENLEGFFTELIGAKKTWLPHSLDTEYLRTGSPVFAFYRIDREEGVSRLVLINLSSDPQEYSLPESAEALKTFGECTADGAALTLAPYAGGIWEVPVPEK